MNELKVKAIDNKVIFTDNLASIDTSNVIATNPPKPYTATEDCWVFCTSNQQTYGYKSVDIDGVEIFYGYGDGQRVNTSIFVKKGQVVNVRASNSPSIAKVFGVKY